MFVDWTWSDTLKAAHVFVLVLILAFNVFLFFRTRSTKVVEDLKKALSDGDEDLRRLVDGHVGRVGESLRDHSQRLAILETTVRHMPTHTDLVGIRRDLGKLSEAVAAINERSETTHDMVRSIQEHLMESK